MKFFKNAQDVPQEEQQRENAASGQKSGQKDAGTLGNIWHWIYKLRTVILAIPVVIGSIILAIASASKLPETLQIYFPSTADKEIMVKMVEMSKGTAIFVPILITAFCLLMMFCSKRVVYPWLISVFSLALPVFFLFISIFPG